MRIAAVVVFGCALLAAHQSTSDWTALIDQGRRAGAEGHYGDAEKIYRIALEQALQEPGSGESLALAMHLLASTLTVEGRIREAQPIAVRALAIREKLFGEESVSTARSMAVLGMIYLANGRYSEAERLLRRATVVEERMSGAQGVELAVAHHGLARVLLAERRYSQAEAEVKGSLEILEKSNFNGNLDRAWALSTLGEILRSRRRFREGELYYQRGLELIEKSLGTEHAGLLRGLAGLAYIRLWQKNYVGAGEFAGRALAIAGRTFGAKALPWAEAATLLALALAGQGRPEEAEGYFKRSLTVYEEVSGTRSKNYAVLLIAYARFLRVDKRPNEAAEMRARAAAITALTNAAIDAGDMAPVR